MDIHMAFIAIINDFGSLKSPIKIKLIIIIAYPYKVYTIPLFFKMACARLHHNS